MLVTERTSDGRTIVRLHKDWHPGRIGIAYKPKTFNQLKLLSKQLKEKRNAPF
jgi:hypothetical protein